MKPFVFTLISDGSTDANLIPIIQWTLKQAGACAISEGRRADFWRLRKKPGTLAERISAAADYFPCDALFIHRDAEGEERRLRAQEIFAAVEAASRRGV